MKVETNLKAGNALDDLANLSCKTANYSAGFVNKADRQAIRLAGAANHGAQTTWNTVVGWLNRI